MLSINTNVNSLVAQQNLDTSQAALSQAITRLSSGKRINSAADDAAGLAISNSMQTQINGLNQGVSNANDGVSMIQTASSGLAEITQSLQTISQLAQESAGGTLTPANQAALQQEVAQQISEVNRVASQTNYNGINLLDGSAGTVNFQVGANVGQTVSLNLTQGLSAATLGGGTVQAGNTLGTITGLNLTDTAGVVGEASSSSTSTITAINVISDGNGGFTFTDQNNQAIPSADLTQGANALFTVTGGSIALNTANAANPLTSAGALAAIGTNYSATAAAGTTFGVISNIAVDPTTGADLSPGSAGFSSAVTSITVKSNGSGGYEFDDQNGNQLSTTAVTAIFGTPPATGGGLAFAAGTGPASTLVAGANPGGTLAAINANNVPPTVSNVNVSTTAGANAAIEAIDNALATVNNIEATLGAAQNRFTAIATSQQSQSTDLSSAQSQISNADFASETAAMSSAQVLQQAGISVLAQANSLPQQVLKLLQ
jgi:flagellin